MKEGVSVGVCSVLKFLTKRRSLPYRENAGKPSGRCEAERMNTATSASRLARAVCISASARARGIGAVLFRFEYDGTSVEGALAGEANDNIAHLIESRKLLWHFLIAWSIYIEDFRFGSSDSASLHFHPAKHNRFSTGKRPRPRRNRSSAPSCPLMEADPPLRRQFFAHPSDLLPQRPDFLPERDGPNHPARAAPRSDAACRRTA